MSATEPSRPPGAPSSSSFFPIAASFYLVLAVTGLVGLGFEHGQLGGTLIADPGAWWVDVGLGLGAGLFLVGLWQVLRLVSRGAERVELELAELIGHLEMSEAAALALVSALGEELAFRGAFQVWIGWVPSAILFAALHLGPGRHFRWWAAWALVGGLGLGWMVDQRGSLGAAVIAHLVVNGIQLERLRRRLRRGAGSADLNSALAASGAGEPEVGASAASAEGPATTPSDEAAESAGEDTSAPPEKTHAADSADRADD